jgi:hypothetical protein
MDVPPLPLLRPGTHFVPEDGACLMEMVSMLAGEPFSDHPRCTDPTLATIARVVNDALDDDSRQALAPLASTLVGRSGNPVRLAPLLVDICLTITQQHLPQPSVDVERHRRRATRRLAALNRSRPAWAAGPTAWLYARGPAQHAITAMIVALRRLPAHERDQTLLRVLGTAVAATPQTARRDWSEQRRPSRSS